MYGGPNSKPVYEETLDDPNSFIDGAGLPRAQAVTKIINETRQHIAIQRSHEIEDQPHYGRVIWIPVIVSATLDDAVGFYKIKRFLPPALPDPTGDILESDIGQLEDDDSFCVGMCLTDLQAGAYTLPTGETCYAMAHHIGYYTAGDGPERSQKTLYVLAQLPNQQIPVTLEKTSGSDGTASAAATWVYTASSLNGDVIATGLSPAQNRPKGKTTFATRGTIIFVDGSAVLHWCDEVPNFAECT